MADFLETPHNIVKHSAATKVEISVARTNGNFEFSVRDTGRGFSISDHQAGNGLKNIRRRAAEMKARLEISSDPDHGTRIQLTTNAP